VIADGAMPEKTSTNEAWDPFGGMPDPYVNIFLNTAFVVATAYKDNTLAPAWNQFATVTIASGSKLQLDVKDDDYDVDPLMFSCSNISITADLLRKHGGAYMATCNGSTTAQKVRFYFVPQ
jgi:Ca2+-dependent lipid-binding protein